jgi:hypothetical protein
VGDAEVATIANTVRLGRRHDAVWIFVHVFVNDFLLIAGRAVIDDNDLDAVEGLRDQPTEALLKCVHGFVDRHDYRYGLNSTRFVGQRGCLFHAATLLWAEANASRGVWCPWRWMSHSVL